MEYVYNSLIRIDQSDLSMELSALLRRWTQNRDGRSLVREVVQEMLHEAFGGWGQATAPSLQQFNLTG